MFVSNSDGLQPTSNSLQPSLNESESLEAQSLEPFGGFACHVQALELLLLAARGARAKRAGIGLCISLYPRSIPQERSKKVEANGKLW